MDTGRYFKSHVDIFRLCPVPVSMLPRKRLKNWNYHPMVVDGEHSLLYRWRVPVQELGIDQLYPEPEAHEDAVSHSMYPRSLPDPLSGSYWKTANPIISSSQTEGHQEPKEDTEKLKIKMARGSNLRAAIRKRFIRFQSRKLIQIFTSFWVKLKPRVRRSSRRNLLQSLLFQ